MFLLFTNKIKVFVLGPIEYGYKIAPEGSSPKLSGPACNVSDCVNFNAPELSKFDLTQKAPKENPETNSINEIVIFITVRLLIIS